MGIGKVLIGIGLGVAGVKVAENKKVRKFVDEVTKKPRETLVKGLRDVALTLEKLGKDEPAEKPAEEKS